MITDNLFDKSWKYKCVCGKEHLFFKMCKKQLDLIYIHKFKQKLDEKYSLPDFIINPK